MPNFPFFEGRRVRSGHGSVEPFVDGEEIWAELPVRVVHTPTAGVVLVIGPYELDSDDIGVLRDALRAVAIADSGGESELRLIR